MILSALIAFMSAYLTFGGKIYIITCAEAPKASAIGFAAITENRKIYDDGIVVK